jgi:hypothetical protein
MAGRSRFDTRLRAILDPGVNRRGLSRVGVAVATALVVTALPLAAAHLAARPAASPAELRHPASRARMASVPVHLVPAALPATMTSGSAGQRPSRTATPAVVARIIAPALEIAPAPEPAEESSDVQKPGVGLTGTWVPRDPAKNQALFEVGLADVPGSGSLTITQDARTISIVRTDPTGQWARLAEIGTDLQKTTVCNLDGSESRIYYSTATVSPGGHAEIIGITSVVARWTGDQLVISGTSSIGEWQEIYSMEGADLRVEFIGRNRIVLFYKKAVQAPDMR